MKIELNVNEVQQLLSIVSTGSIKDFGGLYAKIMNQANQQVAQEAQQAPSQTDTVVEGFGAVNT